MLRPATLADSAMAIAVSLTLGCDREPTIVENEGVSVELRSLPMGGRVVWRSPLVRDDLTLVARWELDLMGWTWDGYAYWLERQLPDYDSRPCGRGLVFTNLLVDSFSVYASPSQEPARLSVSLEFVAQPF